MDRDRKAQSTATAAATPGMPMGAENKRESSDRRRSQSRPQSDRRQTPSPRARPTKHLPHYWRAANINWHDKWSESSWEQGRVLLIDYVRQDHVSAGRIKIVAQEFHSDKSLRKFYADKQLCNQAALRVIHVQNAPWATRFLLHKFNIIPQNELVGMDFGRWLKFERPEWRAGKPLLKGKTWRTQRDPWRGVVRTAFGVDYLKAYEAAELGRQAENVEPRAVDNKMAELNQYDDNDGPSYGYDLFVQRLSVYVQHAEESPVIPDDVANPYVQPAEAEGQRHQPGDMMYWNGKYKPSMPTLPPVGTLDNSSTIIVFENSQNQDVRDTLIQARDEIESRWRRLTFYLPRSDISSDERLTLACMNVVLQDILKALAVNWDTFLSISETHVSILEDKIYESPADETRAPELWNNSSLWLKVEKLAFIHIDVVKTLANRLTDFTETSTAAVSIGSSSIPEDDAAVVRWLEGIPAEFEKLADLVQEDLIKPTDALNDLMYKSVGIRDSRQGLQLNTSMWRLSWITFIFLPLTFIVSFFSMSVNVFANHPSIKWWFIVAIPMMVLVLVGYYVVKHIATARQRTPYQRGVYTNLYHDLAVAHPTLWTRAGPRDNVRPQGIWGSIKWRLVTYWLAPEKTILQKPADPDEDAGASGLGMWARTTRMLARRWLGTIRTSAPPAGDEEGVAPGAAAVDGNVFGGSDDAPGAITELVELAHPVAVAVAEAEPEPSTHPVTLANLTRLHPQGRVAQPGPGSSARVGSPRGSAGGRPSSSGGSSGVMVEEAELDDAAADGVNRAWLPGAPGAGIRGRGGFMRWPWEERVDLFGR